MPHAAVTNGQRSRAKTLRHAMTRAETLLWRYIKANRVEGLSFRRQVPLRNYIADFVCHAAKLIVELDGESHDFGGRQHRDVARDAWFRSQGFQVLRFTNDDVLKNLDGVIATIREAAAGNHNPTPLPGPPPQGGREAGRDGGET